MKKLSILALSAVMSIAPAFAEVNSTATPAKTTAQEMELSFAFDDIENLQVKEMTVAQMQETEGAWVANAVGGLAGGLGGHFAYMGSVAASGQYNFGHHATSVVGGAGLGFVSPVKAVGRAIVMTKGTQAAVNAAITIGSPTVGSIVGKQFKTLNIR